MRGRRTETPSWCAAPAGTRRRESLRTQEGWTWNARPLEVPLNRAETRCSYSRLSDASCRCRLDATISDTSSALYRRFASNCGPAVARNGAEIPDFASALLDGSSSCTWLSKDKQAPFDAG